MRCERVEGRLAAAAAGEVDLSPAELRHVQRCLRCQAELVQHRRVRNALHALRAARAEPAAQVLSDVLTGLDSRVTTEGRRSRAAYVAGVAAATAAGAVGAVVIASRVRRPVGAHG